MRKSSHGKIDKATPQLSETYLCQQGLRLLAHIIAEAYLANRMPRTKCDAEGDPQAEGSVAKEKRNES